MASIYTKDITTIIMSFHKRASVLVGQTGHGTGDSGGGVVCPALGKPPNGGRAGLT